MKEGSRYLKALEESRAAIAEFRGVVETSGGRWFKVDERLMRKSGILRGWRIQSLRQERGRGSSQAGETPQAT
jgi:hypothetical protein